MRRLRAIGIGTGNPEHLTLQAVRALAEVDVVFAFDKGANAAELQHLRREICERHIAPRPYRVVAIADAPRDASIGAYERRVDVWHERRLSDFEESVARELREGQTGALLVWGDASLYDSTLRLLERAQARGRVAFDYDVIPGIGSLQALAAAHRLSLNRVGGAVQVTTGRRLAEAVPSEADDIVVMLDGEQAFERVPAGEFEIYWSAYLGSEREVNVSGPLADRAEEIARLRAELRAEHGWIMDTYLLRRRA